MEIDDLTLLMRAEPQIRVALEEPGLDVPTAFHAGDLKVLRECVLRDDGRVEFTGAMPPATRWLFNMVLKGRPFVIATSGKLHHACIKYKEQLDYVRQNQPTAPPLDIIEGLRRLDPSKLEKVAGRIERHGRNLIPRPYMGSAVPMEFDTSIKLHWLMVDDAFRAALEPDIEAVFEIGCGTGEALVKLALGSERDIPFFGGEIARHGRACLQEIARAAGLENVHAVPFDICDPDFSFLKGHSRVLLLSHAALVYGKDGLKVFWDRLFSVVPGVKACLFEQVSYAVPEVLDRAMFPRDQAIRYGFDLSVYPELLRRAGAGEIVLDEVVPDISGINILSPATLIRFHTPS